MDKVLYLYLRNSTCKFLFELSLDASAAVWLTHMSGAKTKPSVWSKNRKFTYVLSCV